MQPKRGKQSDLCHRKKTLSAPRVVVVIPAFNEEAWIGKTIDLVRGTGIPAGIIVVNDGSSDKTGSIAQKKECRVISSTANRGKAFAVFTGFAHALKEDPDAVVVLDADMAAVPGRGLQEMVEYACRATREKKVRMFVAPVIEGHNRTSNAETSGIRAFSAPAVRLLKASRWKSLAKGYGLEQFFFYFFKLHEQTVLPYRGFRARRALWHEAQGKMGLYRQSDEISRTRKRVKKKRAYLRR